MTPSLGLVIQKNNMLIFICLLEDSVEMVLARNFKFLVFALVIRTKNFPWCFLKLNVSSDEYPVAVLQVAVIRSNLLI